MRGTDFQRTLVYEVENSMIPHRHDTAQNISLGMMVLPLLAALSILMTMVCCTAGENGKTADEADGDTVAQMQSWGVSQMISDSGVMKYHMVAEEWDIYNNTRPPKWVFVKGLIMEKYDSSFHTDWFVKADTAYCYDQKLWELRGRVTARNIAGTLFTSEELFWDMDKHELYSNMFMTIRKPTEFLQGYHFRSNEAMTRYTVDNANGMTPYNDKTDTDTLQTTTPATPENIDVQDSIKNPIKDSVSYVTDHNAASLTDTLPAHPGKQKRRRHK